MAKSIPAFPRPASLDNGGDSPRNVDHQDGMTLRDYLAGQALVGMMNADYDWIKQACKDLGEPSTAKTVALICYSTADAMLEVRAT